MNPAPPQAGARRRTTAPAKVNLGLRIVGRRPDGYHELESLFVPLSLADDVAVEVVDPAAARAEVELIVAGDAAGVPPAGDNLVVRAAHAFLSAASVAAHVRIALTKRIPPESGLGGGSSDAGATLRLLADLWPDARLSQPLPDLALGLGADVPFFLARGPARVGGIGEQVTPAPGLPALPLLLLRPAAGLATAAVYRAYAASGAALTPPGKGPTVRALAALTENPDAAAGSGDALLANDLEGPATGLCPQIGDLRALLHEAGARAVGLSGSGPVVFGIFATLRQAEAAGEGAALRGGGPLWKWAGTTEASR